MHRINFYPAEDDDGDVIVRFNHAVALEGIEILRGGSGRLVEAYCAVFGVPAAIKDQHGEYEETIDRSAFNRAIAQGTTRVTCLYNHGMDATGQANGLLSVPIGSPVEIKPDGKGLLTITRFNKSEVAEGVLEAIRSGDIKGYSFRGRVYKSRPDRIQRARPGDKLPSITRLELGLAEYGPTPMPYYQDAGIVAVRGSER